MELPLHHRYIAVTSLGRWNFLDGTIVIISIADLLISIVFAELGVNMSFLRILRMLRVMRVLRLMRSWRGLYRICMTFIKALPQMSNVLVLMLLCMTIFALLGMQLFGGQVKLNATASLPRHRRTPLCGLTPRVRMRSLPGLTLLPLLLAAWVDRGRRPSGHASPFRLLRAGDAISLCAAHRQLYAPACM